MENLFCACVSESIGFPVSHCSHIRHQCGAEDRTVLSDAQCESLIQMFKDMVEAGTLSDGHSIEKSKDPSLDEGNFEIDPEDIELQIEQDVEEIELAVASGKLDDDDWEIVGEDEGATMGMERDEEENEEDQGRHGEGRSESNGRYARLPWVCTDV